MPEQGPWDTQRASQEHKPHGDRVCGPSLSPWVTCSFHYLARDVARGPWAWPRFSKGPVRPRLCWPQFLPPVNTPG